MSDAAPPSWVKRAPGLSAAHKFMLCVLWGWGPYAGNPEKWVTVDGDQQPADVVRPWPSRETLAELTDQSVGTVKNQLRKLAAEGWIRRENSSVMTLAWRAPHVFDYGRGTTSAPPRATGEPAQIMPPPDHGCTPPDQICTPPRTTGAPLSSTYPVIDPPTNAEAASADDATPEPLSLDERIAATSPAAAMANSMGHPSNPKSWAGIMREAVLDLSLDDDAVIRVLVAWEAAPRETKPTMGKLWWSSNRAWVAEVLGVKPTVDAKPASTKRTPNGQAAYEHMLERQRKRDAETRLAVVS